MNLRQQMQSADEPTRRAFLSGLAQGTLGLTAMPLFAASARAQAEGEVPLKPATARNVIYLYMSGGMSHLDTFDTKPGAETQGPTESIRTSADGVQVAANFSNLARHMDKVAVLNSVFSTQGAHAQGRYFMHTSYELRGTIKHPSMGAWLNRMAGPTNPTLPGHVAIRQGQYMASGGFFESKYVPLPIGDPASGLQNSARHGDVDAETFDRRLERVRKMNEEFKREHDQKKVRAYTDMYDQALALMNSSDLAAFDISQENERIRDAYGQTRFGQGCLLARRLVEHGVRYVEVVSGGWDTHNDNFDEMDTLIPPVDQALSSLIVDLDARGLLDETLIVLATEFGRTPKIVTERTGRNHYPKAFSCLLAGGGVRGGQKYGKTDATGSEIIENPVSVPDFNATIAYALGLPLDHTVYSASGRPFTVADKGQPVTALF